VLYITSETTIHLNLSPLACREPLLYRSSSGTMLLPPYLDTVTTQSQSDARIESEFGSEQSYQISEEGNRIGLGFNLCVALARTICRYVRQFWNSCWRPESTVVRQWSDRGSWRSRVSKQIGWNNELDKIIRLSCIEGNTRLIYRRFG